MRSNTWPLYFLMSSNHSLFFTCRWFGSCVGPVFLHKVSGLVWSSVSACQIGWTGAAKVTTLCQHHVQLHWDVEVNKHTLMFSVKPQNDFIAVLGRFWSDSVITCSISVYQQGAELYCSHCNWFKPWNDWHNGVTLTYTHLQAHYSSITRSMLSV